MKISMFDNLIPEELTNFIRRLGNMMLNTISVFQLYIYFLFWDIPMLRWTHYVFKGVDLILWFCWWYLKLCWRIFVQIARLYPVALRWSVRLIVGYSLMVYLCNIPDVAAKLPMLENLLQNGEWLYDFAVSFVDFNIHIIRKLVEHLHEYATTHDIPFITYFDQFIAALISSLEG